MEKEILKMRKKKWRANFVLSEEEKFVLTTICEESGIKSHAAIIRLLIQKYGVPLSKYLKTNGDFNG